MAASPRARVEPQGVDRRPVRHPLRDLRPDARRRRGPLGGRGRRRRRRPDAAGRPALPLHGLPRPARRLGAAPGAARSPTTCAGSTADVGVEADARDRCAAGSPTSTGADDLPDELLDLHTAAPARRARRDPRADRGRPAGGARSWPPSAWPSLHAHPAGQPARHAARAGRRPCAYRPAHVRPPSGTQFRERNPWLAFEDAFRRSAASSSASRAGPLGPVQARLGEDLRSLGEGTATAVLRPRQPERPARAARRAERLRPDGPTPRVRLVLGQPPMRPNLERLAAAYHATSWVLGREAAALLPDRRPRRCLAPRRRGAGRRPRSAGRSRPSSRSMARDGRVVQLVDGGPEAIVAAVIGRCVGRLPAARARGWPTPTRTRRRSSSCCRPAASCRRDRGPAPTSASSRSPGGAGRPGPRPGPRPVRAARAVRPAAVLRGRRRPDRDRDRRRDAARPRRAGPLRAAARRDPGRARSGRAAPPAGRRRRSRRPAGPAAADDRPRATRR